MILGIETSGPISSVALVSGGRRWSERFFESRRALNQMLAGQIADMCDGRPLSEAGIEGVAVGIGPGSFTGVRMGVALAKAVAHALGVPLVGVSAPEAMATSLAVRPHYTICVLQKARAGEVYMTVLVMGEGGIARELAPTQVLRLARALKAAEELLGRPPDHLCGDAAREHCGTIQEVFDSARVGDEPSSLVRAADVAAIGEARMADADPETVFTLRPRYVRLSQAEREHGVDLKLR